MDSDFKPGKLSDRFFKTGQLKRPPRKLLLSAYQLSMLGFALFITVGTLLLLLPFSLAQPGHWQPLTALFESTSAICVTGLSPVDISQYYSLWGQIFLMLLIQVGGLGYMTLYSLMLLAVGKRLSLRDQLAAQEVLDLSGPGGVKRFVLRILAFSVFFEVLGALLLALAWVPEFGWRKGLYFAFFHAVSAFNNAGFSLFSDSLVGYSYHPWILGVVATLIILGGLGFPVLWELYKALRQREGRLYWRELSFYTWVSLSVTGILLLLGTLFYLLLEARNPNTLGAQNWGGKIMGAIFMSVTPRTAGFNALDIGVMTPAAVFGTLSLMLVGGNPGGTAGGIKTTTLAVILARLRATLRGQSNVQFFRRRLSQTTEHKAWVTLILSVLWINVITFLMCLTEAGQDFLAVLFEVVSAFGTVGLSVGLTAHLSVLGQILIILTMYIGRVGILAAGLAFSHQQRLTLVKYPEDNLMVG